MLNKLLSLNDKNAANEMQFTNLRQRKDVGQMMKLTSLFEGRLYLISVEMTA